MSFVFAYLRRYWAALLLASSLVAMGIFVPHWSAYDFWLTLLPCLVFLWMLLSIRNAILRVVLVDVFFWIATAGFGARVIYKYMSKDMILATLGVSWDVSIGILETVDPRFVVGFLVFILVVSVLAGLATVPTPRSVKYAVLPLALILLLADPARLSLKYGGWRNFLINNAYSATFLAQDYIDQYKLFFGDMIAGAMIGVEDVVDRAKYATVPHEHVPEYVSREGDGEDKVIFVIGEASNVKRYGLYGYDLPTTPNLNALEQAGSICKVEKVHSPTPTTRTSIPLYVSFATPEAREALFDDKNIVEMAKQNHYQTYWIGAQTLDTIWDKTYGFVAKYSDVLASPGENTTPYAIRDTKDDDLIAPVQHYFAAAPKKAFFIIHLYGSHLPYKRNVDTQDTNDLLEADFYDRSIHHTDRTLKAIIDAAEKNFKNYKLVYLPDHGEAIYHGHGFHTAFNEMYLIPLLSNAKDGCAALEALRGVDGFVRSDVVKYLLLHWLGYKIDDKTLDQARQNSAQVLSGEERIIDFRSLADCKERDCPD